jgi:hypothetical protein
MPTIKENKSGIIRFELKYLIDAKHTNHKIYDQLDKNKEFARFIGI